jgi:hypothetical protein
LDFSEYNDAVKSREEYLLKYEERLLTSLGAVYQSVNRTVALMYTTTAIVLLVEWGRVTELNLFGAKLPLNGLEVIVAGPVILSVLAVFLDYSLITASRVLRELKENAEELLKLNADAKPVSLITLDLFGTGVIGFLLSFARGELRKLLTIQAVLPPGLTIRDSFFDFVRVAFALLRWNRRLIDWGISILIRIAFILGIFGLPLIGSASVISGSLGVDSADPGFWRFVAAAPLVLLGFVGISLIVCTLLLLFSYSADFLDTVKKDFLEMTKMDVLLPIYQSMIEASARLLIRLAMPR